MENKEKKYTINFEITDTPENLMKFSRFISTSAGLSEEECRGLYEKESMKKIATTIMVEVINSLPGYEISQVILNDSLKRMK
jgi:pantoate kinase